MQILSPLSPSYARSQAGQFSSIAPIRFLSYFDRGDRSIMHLALDTKDTHFFKDKMPLMPMAGDVVGILPENCKEHIELLQQYLNKNDEGPFLLSRQHESDEGTLHNKEDAFKYVSLNPLKPETLLLLKKRLSTTKFQDVNKQRAVEKLDQLLKLHEQAPEDCQKILKHCHVLDVLQAFSGILSLRDICRTQKAIYRRVYTISGISRDSFGKPESIQFLLALGVRYKIPAEGFFPGTSYEGICSSYLHKLLSRDETRELVYTRFFVQARSFGGPEKDRRYFARKSEVIRDKEFLKHLKTPLFLIAAGSGISGIRAVLEERAAWKKMGYSVGSASLLYGLRNTGEDFIFQDDLRHFQEQGILERIVLAESRPSKGEKKYVQHVLIESGFGKEIKEFAHAKRVIVICGDKRMGQTIGDVCLPVLISKMYEKHRHQKSKRSFEALEEDHHLKNGREAITKLKEAGFLIRSTSGSRYPKIKLDFQEVYKSYFSG